MRATLAAIKEIDPLTVFHEPINIRAENVQRIEKHAQDLGVTLKPHVFATPAAWRRYALDSLVSVQLLATEVGLDHCLHLWPDKSLKSRAGFLRMRQTQCQTSHAGTVRSRQQRAEQREADLAAYQEHVAWVEGWHARISEWPRQPRSMDWKVLTLPGMACGLVELATADLVH